MSESQSLSGPDAPPFRRLLQLTQLSSRQLDERFSQGSVGAVPTGTTTGVALLRTGSRTGRALAWMVRLCAWQGKVFQPERNQLVNRILPFGLRAIRADVYHGDSLFDGKPCVVIDYSKTSLIARMVRDEIREIEPGVHLGQVFLFGRLAAKFALIEEAA